MGFILSLVVLYIGLKDVRHLEAISRRLLIITGTIFVTFIAVFVSYIMGAEFDLEQVGIMVSVILPAFFVFAFGKPLSANLRSELSLSLGTFLVLFGVFLSIFYHTIVMCGSRSLCVNILLGGSGFWVF